MRAQLTMVVIAVCTFFAHGQHASPPTSADFDKLDWIGGMWTRKGAKPGQSGHERWQRTSAKEWIGFGVTMRGQDTAFVEKLKIATKGNNIYYISDVPENKQPVYFKVTEIAGTGFVCENPDHNFPKRIAYVLEGTRLKATISGDGKSIDYLFER